MQLPASFSATTADERTQLNTFLDEHRGHIAAALDGLTEEQARRSLVSSKTTLLGLVKHAAFVETIWFNEAITGTPRASLGLPATADESFDLSADDTIESVLARHARACDASREACRALTLDDVLTGHRFGPMTLRWVMVHCIREFAQHAGHADILREQILNRD